MVKCLDWLNPILRFSFKIQFLEISFFAFSFSSTIILNKLKNSAILSTVVLVALTFGTKINCSENEKTELVSKRFKKYLHKNKISLNQT